MPMKFAKRAAEGVAAETPDPSWVAVHPSGKFLYAANEAGKASTVSAFAIDAKNGKLTILNQLPALGEDPCYLSLDKTAKYVLVANYSSGTIAVFPILADGRLGEHTALVKDEGATGPNKERQEAPHAHWIGVTPGNLFAFVADRGHDSIVVFDIEEANGTLTQVADVSTGGKEPRHFAIDPSGKYLLAENQFSNNIVVFKIDPTTGGLTPTGHAVQVPSPVDLTF